MIPTRYTHEQLASMIGANREALTRAFSELQEGGRIEVRSRRVYVKDFDAPGRDAGEQGRLVFDLSRPTSRENRRYPGEAPSRKLRTTVTGLA